MATTTTTTGADATATTRRTPSGLRFLSSTGNNNQDDDSSAKISKLDPRNTEWIPPNRPLAGDQGFSHLYLKNKKEEAADKAAAEEETKELARLEKEVKLLEEEELARLEREVKLLEDEAHLSPEEQLERIQEELKLLEAEAEKEEQAAQLQQEQQAHEQQRQQLTVAQPQNTKPVAQPQRNMDWLQTRREKLGDDNNFLTPSYERPTSHELPVLHHTLLTSTEIINLLWSLGGTSPNLVQDQVINEHGDTRLGGAYRGIIFVSGHSSAHVRMMAQSLVEQLKLRKLQEVGVMGARHGAEGSEDADETWFSVDCHNYIVNLMDDPTRRMLNLEEWWGQADPMAEIHKQYGGNVNDDDEAMDEFVARNPVPPDYGRSGLHSKNWSDSISDLRHRRMTAPHRRVSEMGGNTNRRGKKGKGKRRV